MMNIPVITIDGPSAVGKGTIAKRIAHHLNFYYLESGAIYRAIAFSSQQIGVSWHDEQGLLHCLSDFSLQFEEDRIYWKGHEIGNDIRTEDIGLGAAQISQYASLRLGLIDFQRGFQKLPGLVAEGRDMGTVIFPQAEIKFFLTASLETRAKRRYQQLLKQNIVAEFNEVQQQLIVRDQQDATRKTAPLRMAESAFLIETDIFTVEETEHILLSHIQDKLLHR